MAMQPRRSAARISAAPDLGAPQIFRRDLVVRVGDDFDHLLAGGLDLLFQIGGDAFD